MGVPKIIEPNLDDIFHLYWSYASEASHHPEQFYKNLSTEDFIKFVSLRNHKSRGVDVEKRIALKNGWHKIKLTDESGDLTDEDGKKVEVKSSIVTPNKDSSVTLRGFRNWETEVDYYLAVILDIRNFRKGIQSYIYKLPKHFPTAENGFKPYSQNKNARSGKNHPLGINFQIGDHVFSRWESQFRSDKVIF